MDPWHVLIVDDWKQPGNLEVLAFLMEGKKVSVNSVVRHVLLLVGERLLKGQELAIGADISILL